MIQRIGFAAIGITLIAIVLVASAPQETAASAGGVKSFTVDKATFRVNVPEGWTELQDLFGMPVMIAAPQVGALRTVVSITPSGRDDIRLDETHMKETYGDYRKGRLEWLEERSGKLLSFEKFKTESIGNLTAYVAGVSYELGGTKFSEKSYYINCGQELYFIKSLVPDGSSMKDAEKLVRSLDCAANG